MPLRSSFFRYGSLAQSLHWLTALLIIAMLILGSSMEDFDGATKLNAYRAHVIGGILVLVLTLIRLGWRFVDNDRPQLPDDMGGLMRLAARGAHWLLYILMLALAGSGIGTLLLSGIGPILFGGADRPLPDEIEVPPLEAHELFASIMIALLVLHVAAALYHHFLRKDDVLRQMLPGGD